MLHGEQAANNRILKSGGISKSIIIFDYFTIHE
jgi:hypothetical protein